MSSLYRLDRGEDNDFFRLLAEHIGYEDAKKLMKHPSVVEAMAKTMREQPVFRLVHGRFHTLAEKVDMVKAWPGISDRFTERLVLLDGIKPMMNCLKVEVVDLGVHWNRKHGFTPKDIRNAKSAHAQVLYAGAEDTDWVRQMNPYQGVPYAFMGGYVLTVPGRVDGTILPDLWFDHESGKAWLSGNCCGARYYYYSLPAVWE